LHTRVATAGGSHATTPTAADSKAPRQPRTSGQDASAKEPAAPKSEACASQVEKSSSNREGAEKSKPLRHAMGASSEPSKVAEPSPCNLGRGKQRGDAEVPPAQPVDAVKPAVDNGKLEPGRSALTIAYTPTPAPLPKVGAPAAAVPPAEVAVEKRIEAPPVKSNVEAVVCSPAEAGAGGLQTKDVSALPAGAAVPPEAAPAVPLPTETAAMATEQPTSPLGGSLKVDPPTSPKATPTPAETSEPPSTAPPAAAPESSPPVAELPRAPSPTPKVTPPVPMMVPPASAPAPLTAVGASAPTVEEELVKPPPVPPTILPSPPAETRVPSQVSAKPEVADVAPRREKQEPPAAEAAPQVAKKKAPLDTSRSSKKVKDVAKKPAESEPAAEHVAEKLAAADAMRERKGSKQSSLLSSKAARSIRSAKKYDTVGGSAKTQPSPTHVGERDLAAKASKEKREKKAAAKTKSKGAKIATRLDAVADAEHRHRTTGAPHAAPSLLAATASSKEANSVLRALDAKLKGPRVCILGGTAFNEPDSEELCKSMGKKFAEKLSAYEQEVSVITGGNTGVQQAFSEAFGESASLYHLVPRGQKSGIAAGKDLEAGSSPDVRREVMGGIGGFYVVIEGGPGVAAEARLAVARDAVVVPLKRTGGASCGLFHFPEEGLRRPAHATFEQWRLLCDEDEDVEEATNALVGVLEGWLGSQGVVLPAKEAPKRRCCGCFAGLRR